MNKKFEYIDDNPGSYFGMLVESFEDKKELKESVVGNAKNWLIDKEGKSPKEAEKIINSLSPEEIEEIALKWTKQRKLKEDKFVPQDKMSKKAQKELNDKKRGTWGNTNPVTRVQPNKKAYDRKRDKKVVDEALNIGYWSADSWGSDYLPDNWEEVVSRANEMIKNKYLQTYDEESTRDYSSRLWDGYCRRARQLEKQKDKKVVDEDIENKDSEEYLGVDEVKRFVNAREKLLDISDSMTTDLRLGRISREDVLYYRNEIKEIYSFLNSLYFGR